MSHGGRGVFLQLKMIRWEYPIKKANDDEGSFCRRDMPLAFNQAHTLKRDKSINLFSEQDLLIFFEYP